MSSGKRLAAAAMAADAAGGTKPENFCPTLRTR